MAQRRGSGDTSRAVAAVRRQGRRVAGPKAISRLEKSLEAAELALKDLRRELGRGGRDVVKDLDRTLKDSRKNLRSLSRTVARDLGALQKAATRGTSPTTARRTASARPGAKRASRGRSATSRSTAGSRSTSREQP